MEESDVRPLYACPACGAYDLPSSILRCDRKGPCGVGEFDVGHGGAWVHPAVVGADGVPRYDGFTFVEWMFAGFPRLERVWWDEWLASGPPTGDALLRPRKMQLYSKHHLKRRRRRIREAQLRLKAKAARRAARDALTQSKSQPPPD